MDANTIVILIAAGAAVVGGLLGFVVGRAINQGTGLAIAIAVIGALGAGGVGWFLANQDVIPRQQFDAARQAAEGLPEVQALKAHYPVDYAKLQNDLEMIKGERGGALAVNQTVRSNTNAVLLRETPKANDANILVLMKLKRDKAQALSAKSPAYCYDFTRNARLTFDVDAAIGPDLVKRERDAATAILIQAATDPVKDAEGAIRNPDKLPGLIKKYYQDELRYQIQDRVLATFPPADAKIISQLTGRKVSVSDPARQTLLCRYNIALIDEQLKLPAEKAAMVYRLGLGKGL
ncbi:MAG TPA: hypothetical protein VEA44_09140 [Caulobacter sp.]|nr:hypothetical protein [Caulobacter sp.]